MNDRNSMVIRPATASDSSQIESLLVANAGFYPGILKWWRAKVQPGLQGYGGSPGCRLVNGVPSAGSLSRLVLIATCGDIVAGVVIVKRGQRPKVSTLLVHPHHRHKGIGTKLIVAGLSWLLDGKSNVDVRLTLSGVVAQEVAPYFERFGFVHHATVPDRYVKGVPEHIYLASSQRLREITRRSERLQDGAVFMNRIIMSIHERPATLILSGNKRVEFRRRFSSRHENSLVLFYVTAPSAALLLTAHIRSVDQGDPDWIWQRHGHHGGIQESEFRAYFRTARRAYAILIEEVTRLRASLDLSTIRRAIPGFRPPQSFRIVRPWTAEDRLISELFESGLACSPLSPTGIKHSFG